MVAQRNELAQDKAIGAIEPVAHFSGPMPMGVTVSQAGCVCVNFPKWGDQVDFTVAEVRGGAAVAYPNAEINRESDDQASVLLSVQSVVVDPRDRLWILDTGSPMMHTVGRNSCALTSLRTP